MAISIFLNSLAKTTESQFQRQFLDHLSKFCESNQNAYKKGISITQNPGLTLLDTRGHKNPHCYIYQFFSKIM